MSASYRHEGLVELFRKRPELAPELLRDALGVELPTYAEARIESADFSELHPATYRADLVVLLAGEKPVLAIVVEVQLGKETAKRFTWPVYATSARARFRCPACVLVFTADEAVARWAARPIAVGPGSVFEVQVVGPGAVPVVREVEQARQAPELAVLSATAHGRDERLGAEVAFAATVASAGLDAERAALYWDMVLASLNDATRAALEEIMSSGHYQYQSDFAKKYYAEGKAEGKAERKAEGKAEGKAEDVLRVLAARRIAVTDEQKQRILRCTDPTVLERWLERAATLDSAADVLAD
jgi:hypothetical protein